MIKRINKNRVECVDEKINVSHVTARWEVKHERNPSTRFSQRVLFTYANFVGQAENCIEVKKKIEEENIVCAERK